MPIRSLRSIVADQTPITAAKTATVVEAALMMKQQNIGALLVVDGSRLIGIFTERDALFRVLAQGRDPMNTRLADVMTTQRRPTRTAVVQACGHVRWLIRHLRS